MNESREAPRGGGETLERMSRHAVIGFVGLVYCNNSLDEVESNKDKDKVRDDSDGQL